MARGSALVLIALVGSALTACAEERRRPPAAPRVDLARPVALIPADVDLVLRLDVRRCRELLGPEWAQTLANLWQGFLLDPNAGTPNRAWFAPVLREADALWLGCRMGVLGCQDFVVVLRGRFEQPLAKYGLGANEGERELGGGWVSYDARTSERVSIARVYSRPPELLVLVSPAEVDSAERSIEGAAGATGLVPRETGLVSVLVRSQALADSLRSRSPKAAQWLQDAQRVEIQMEPQPGQTLLTFAVAFGDAARAERAAQAIKLLTRALAQFERRVQESDIDVQQLDSEVVLRVRLGANR